LARQASRTVCGPSWTVRVSLRPVLILSAVSPWHISASRGAESFHEVTADRSDETRRMFGEYIDELYDEEEDWNIRGSDDDTKPYTLFKTNHPDITVPGDGDEDGSGQDLVERIHVVARVIRLYKYRWGIENGFKQIKQFRGRTTSMNHEYRFFNFLFACTLYTVWRLVDILVKLELRANSEFAYKPIVTADMFLTIVSDYLGLDPPD
jgi:putative transposase